MKPQNKLREAMMGVQGRIDTPAPTSQQEPTTLPVRSKSRLGRRPVQGYVSPEAFRQLHLLAVDMDCSIQDLIVESLNDLFRKHNKSAIA